MSGAATRDTTTAPAATATATAAATAHHAAYRRQACRWARPTCVTSRIGRRAEFLDSALPSRKAFEESLQLPEGNAAADPMRAAACPDAPRARPAGGGGRRSCARYGGEPEASGVASAAETRVTGALAREGPVIRRTADIDFNSAVQLVHLRAAVGDGLCGRGGAVRPAGGRARETRDTRERYRVGVVCLRLSVARHESFFDQH